MNAYEAHAELCKTLTDAKRLIMLRILRDGERSVGELAAAVGTSLPNASQHLAVMRHAGLVTARREATSVIYSLAEPRIVQACEIVHAIVLERMGASASLRAVRATSILLSS
jgi:ArsR family transcriptional regulator